MRASDEFESLFGVLSDFGRIAEETADVATIAIPSISARERDIEILARAAIGAVSQNSQEGVDSLMKVIFVLYSLGFTDGMQIGLTGKER